MEASKFTFSRFGVSSRCSFQFELNRISDILSHESVIPCNKMIIYTSLRYVTLLRYIEEEIADNFFFDKSGFDHTYS